MTRVLYPHLAEVLQASPTFLWFMPLSEPSVKAFRLSVAHDERFDPPQGFPSIVTFATQAPTMWRCVDTIGY